MIGTWPNTHALIATEALKAGKHVLCEARMAMDAAQAKEMLQVARRTPDCVAMLVPSPFTLKFDALIQKTIAEGHLGKILVIDVLGQTPGFVNPDAPMHWRQREDFSGDNVMLMGIFYEALVRWVGEASTVMAMGSTFVPVRRESSEGKLLATRIPDHLDVLCKMQCGAQARLQFSSVMGGKPAQSNQFTLYGTDGSLRLDLDQGEVQLARKTVDDGAWQNLEIVSDAKGWRVEQEFINAVLGEADVKFTTFEDGARYMEFTSAVRRSLESQSIVTLGNALA